VRFIGHKAECHGGKRAKRRGAHRQTTTSDDEADSDDQDDDVTMKATSFVNDGNEAAASNGRSGKKEQLSPTVTTGLCCDSSLPDDEVLTDGGNAMTVTDRAGLKVERREQHGGSPTEVCGSTAAGKLNLRVYK